MSQTTSSQPSLKGPLKGGDSYWFHAKAGIPSGFNCHDGLTSPEDHEQASKAGPASLIFTALTKSLAGYFTR